MGEHRPNRTKAAGANSPRPGVAPAVLVTLLATLGAGTAGAFLSGTAAYSAIGLVALFAAILSATAAQSSGDGKKIRGLLKLADGGGSSEARVPGGYSGEWSMLYQRMNRLAEEARTANAALRELENYRRHGEIATSTLRAGNDPLTEIAELRVGPLRDLLEAAKSCAPTGGSIVSRLSIGEEELIGAGGEALPDPWPKDAPSGPPLGHAINAEARWNLEEIVRGLGELRASLSGNGPQAPAGAGTARTPAQLVDAVVHTAADGIEDLAAGLMRANELASVAERVTNRATLLALNAALEATRSGSEAFAAIAEETRRLAEFAREATDTVSRLASEIEYKVGETITAIHSTSEDAKSSLAQLSGMAPSAAPSSPAARAPVDALLRRARDLQRNLESSVQAGLGPSPERAAQAAVHLPTVDLEAVHDLVENGPLNAEKLSTEGIMLIDGLQSGARLES